MKKTKLIFGLIALAIACVFGISLPEAEAQTVLNFECQDSAMHCFETADVVYYGKAVATSNELDEVIIIGKK